MQLLGFSILLSVLIFLFRYQILDYLNFIDYNRNNSYSKRAGQAFEDFIQDFIFPEHKYILVDKTHPFQENERRFVESSLKPDLLFRNKETYKEFYIECKYRSKLDKSGRFHWSRPDQFERYKLYNRYVPVYIAFGFGGSADNPKECYIIPLAEIKYYSLYPSQFRIQKYLRKKT